MKHMKKGFYQVIFFSHYKLRCKQGDIDFINKVINIGDDVNLRAETMEESMTENGRGLEYEDGIEPRQSIEENATLITDFYICQARIVFTIKGGNSTKEFPTPESEAFNITTESLTLQSSLEVYQ